ncbi:MAG: winged helix-turn-helix transcriptional regulator [Gammaproteobacteria bacterium]|nr:winged helix-turn-helix transcriptional regulator [Gammaproteobacteria bacterium]
MDKANKSSYAARAAVLKALAHPTRLWIVDQLASSERCVCEFVNEVDADFSTVSKHLSVLKQAGIVADDKRGNKVFYKLIMPCTRQFMNCINSVLRNEAAARTAALERTV